jgi:glyoxylase-like metal-dependent hydrolase (beta-lactamase superfamily II)
MKKTTASSRRLFLRRAGLLSGGALLVRYAPANIFEVPAQAGMRQAATAPADPLAMFRAQMGAVPIQTTPLGDRLVLLSGPGGNVVVLHGPDGKVVVDSFLQPAWTRLKSTLDGLDGPPTKTLIDTHWHFDHTDNNASFRAAGAAIVAHANTKKRMSESHDIIGMHFDPSPAAALPTSTFTQKHALRANGEEISLTYAPPAHTDTDIFVHYGKANVLHMGDTFFQGMYPFIDASTGGNINGMIGAAERGLKMTNATTKIVPGHGPLADRAALDAYRTMLTAIRDRVRTQKSAGRTLAEVQAAKPSAEFDAVWGKGMMQPDNFVALVYNTL